VPRVQHVADGVVTAFVYLFPIFAAADLAVYLDDVKQESGFSVNGAGETAGGDVTFDTAPANGVTVTLAREIEITRTSDFQEGGEFRASVLNDELDYLTAALQQVANDVDRTIALSTTDPTSGLVLPDAAARASQYLGFDGTGQLIPAVAPEGGNLVSAFMATVLDDADAASARTTLGAQAQAGLLDSLVALGSPLAAFRNKIVNGGMEVDQRVSPHANSASNVTYTVDRWAMRRAGTAIGMVVEQKSDAPVGFLNSARVRRDEENAETDIMDFAQALETADSVPLQGKVLALTFWAKADAAWTPSGKILMSRISTGTGTDEPPSGMMDGNWTTWTKNDKSHTLTTSWQKFIHVLPAAVADDITQVGVLIRNTPVGTAPTGDWYFITGVQLEAVGASATDGTGFESRPIAAELALCRRYYWQLGGQVANENVGVTGAGGTNNSYITLENPVVMRTAPSFGCSGNWELLAGGAIASFNANEITTRSVQLTCNGTSLTTRNAYLLRAAYDLTARLTLDAELQAMTDYKLTRGDVVVRTSDGLTIPNDPLNRHRRDYEAWLAKANTPDPAETPDDAKVRRQHEVDALRDAKLAAGFVYATLAATFDADAEAQDNITAIAAGIAAGKGLPGRLATIGWWDKSNVTHAMTEAAFLDFAAAHRDFVAFVKQTGRGHKNAMQALATVAAVDAYDIAAGW